MNVILTYKQTSEFTKDMHNLLKDVMFSQVNEMKIISKKIPFQANIKDTEHYETLFTALSGCGEIDIVGTWENNGDKINLDINKYRDLLLNIKVFELDANDVLKQVSSKVPTLTQAKHTQVSVFNNNFVRELS